ncbi:MAG TPA: nicotinamide phosphoribosyltransferase domain-containing protein [Candidatus Angelobacter sp.]|jgi:nicotinic acid phosphoribosyltransferase
MLKTESCDFLPRNLVLQTDNYKFTHWKQYPPGTVQIEYKFNPKWSVSGTRAQNGGFGVDGRYRKDF